MNHTSRRWWLLGAGVAGKLSDVYHYLERNSPQTACGIRMPEAFSRMVDRRHSRRDRDRLRCEACKMALFNKRELRRPGRIH